MGLILVGNLNVNKIWKHSEAGAWRQDKSTQIGKLTTFSEVINFLKYCKLLAEKERGATVCPWYRNLTMHCKMIPDGTKMHRNVLEELVTSSSHFK